MGMERGCQQNGRTLANGHSSPSTSSVFIRISSASTCRRGTAGNGTRHEVIWAIMLEDSLHLLHGL